MAKQRVHAGNPAFDTLMEYMHKNFVGEGNKYIIIMGNQDTFTVNPLKGINGDRPTSIEARK